MTQMNIYLCKRNKLTDIEKRFLVAKGEESGRGKDWNSGLAKAN